MSNLLFQRFFLPIDFTPASRKSFLLDLSHTHHFQIQTEPHTRLLTRSHLVVPEAKGLKMIRILSQKKPFIEIARTVLAEKVDLIDLGSYGVKAGDISHLFFDNTAEKLFIIFNCGSLPHQCSRSFQTQ